MHLRKHDFLWLWLVKAECREVGQMIYKRASRLLGRGKWLKICLLIKSKGVIMRIWSETQQDRRQLQLAPDNFEPLEAIFRLNDTSKPQISSFSELRVSLLSFSTFHWLKDANWLKNCWTDGQLFSGFLSASNDRNRYFSHFIIIIVVYFKSEL